MVSHALVNRADQVWTVFLHREAEVALGVCFSASCFFHALSQAEQHHFIARPWFVRSTILDRAGKGCGEGERPEQKPYPQNCRNSL